MWQVPFKLMRSRKRSSKNVFHSLLRRSCLVGVMKLSPQLKVHGFVATFVSDQMLSGDVTPETNCVDWRQKAFQSNCISFHDSPDGIKSWFYEEIIRLHFVCHSFQAADRTEQNVAESVPTVLLILTYSRSYDIELRRPLRFLHKADFPSSPQCDLNTSVSPCVSL